MSDNVELNPATGGAVIAADEIGGAKYQRMKVVIGADGVNDGDVSAANPLPVSVLSSALPAGAATAAKQDTGNASLASLDGKTVAVNTGAVVVASSALPAGAATAAKQDTGNTSLASIDGKITAVNTGAVVVASSALPAGAATEATLGTISAKDFATQATLALVKAKTDNLDVLLSTRTKPADQQHAIVDSSALPTGAATEATLATRASEATLATRASEATLSTLNGKVTAVDTGNVTVSASALPAGAATGAKQDAGNASLASIDGKLSGALNVTGSTVAIIGSVEVVNDVGNPLPVSGTVAISSGAGTEYADGATTSPSTGKVAMGVVNDAIESYQTNELRPLSMTTSGRLRVSSVPAAVDMEMFDGGNFLTSPPTMTNPENPYSLGSMNPWP